MQHHMTLHCIPTVTHNAEQATGAESFFHLLEHLDTDPHQHGVSIFLSPVVPVQFVPAFASLPNIQALYRAGVYLVKHTPASVATVSTWCSALHQHRNSTAAAAGAAAGAAGGVAPEVALNLSTAEEAIRLNVYVVDNSPQAPFTCSVNSVPLRV
jgi:hypothetical protein